MSPEKIGLFGVPFTENPGLTSVISAGGLGRVARFAWATDVVVLGDCGAAVSANASGVATAPSSNMERAAHLMVFMTSPENAEDVHKDRRLPSDNPDVTNT